MSAIDFVVRDAAGSLQHGSVGGGGITSQLIVGSGADVSLNLARNQIQSYAQEGGALKITLVDGQVIYIDNFFAPGGGPQAELFISANGELAQVQLAPAGDGTFYSNYVEEDVAGKWSPDDGLMFSGREEPVIAGVPADDEAGMLMMAPLAAGAVLLPLLGLAGLGAGTTVLDSSEERENPVGEILTGTKDSGHVVNAEDQADGVDISGTGTPGATVTVTIDGTTETTVISEDGTWDVTFDPTEIDTGTYETPVKVVVSKDGREIEIDDVLVVDTEASVTFDEDKVGGDGMVNAVEAAGGITLTGDTEAGSAVVVTVKGVTYVATVTGTTWSVDIPAANVAPGEYNQLASVTATDQYGNTATTTGTYAVDTRLPLSVNASTIEANGIINASERSDGVAITGRSEPGAVVTVVMGGVTHTAVTGANGRWSVTYAASEVATGTYDAPIAVSAVDAAGNTASITASVKIDTEARVAFAPGPVEGDNIVNADEASDGVVLTGTTEPGSTVMVTFGGQTLAATVAANGNWTVTFPNITPGTYATTAVANAIDANGNAVSATRTIQVDTETEVSVRTVDVETDGTINFFEREDGVTLTGMAEAGATVVVRLEGANRTVTADDDGNWSADFGKGDIPTGETLADVTVTATDLAGNTATATGTINVDTFVNRLNITSGPVGGDGTINQSEAGKAIAINGVVEEGSTVVVTLAGVSRNATVAADGRWSVTFPPGSVPPGEYASQVVVSATDRAGNTASITQSVTVDTVVGDVTLSPDPIEIDDVINFVERSDGVLIHGTATPGLTVTVTLGGVAHQVVAAPDGTWSSLYTASEISQGTYRSDITASITDSAGNTKTVSDAVNVDTAVNPFTLTTPVEGDNILNNAEASNGVQLSGTVEAGSTVMVSYNGVDRAATVAANGSWTLTVPAAAVASGEYNQSFSATATDRAGNTSVITHQVRIDTLVNELSMGRPVEGDNIINRAEAQDGVTLVGRVEAGSTVNVTFEGVTRAATVAADGTWRVTYTGAEVPQGEYDATIRIAATDSVGNTRSITETVAVDTSAPEVPTFESVLYADRGVRAISTSLTEDDIEIHAIAGNGAVTSPAFRATADSEFDEINYRFTTPIPNGSHLVITAEDAAGNSTASLFVLEESLTNTVDIHKAGLSGFNIEEINLQFAEDSELTLTVQDLEQLCSHSNRLTVHGGEDDTVTVIGATLTGDTAEIDGRTYRIYDYGHNGGTLIIDEEIHVVT